MYIQIELQSKEKLHTSKSHSPGSLGEEALDPRAKGLTKSPRPLLPAGSRTLLPACS